MATLAFIGASSASIFLALFLSCQVVSAAGFPDGEKCFGFDKTINYFATESWFEGKPTSARFTLASAFNFGLHTPHAIKSVVGRMRMDLQKDTLIISFYDQDGNLVVEPKRSPARLIECANNRTKVSFAVSFSGDGARSKQEIVVSLSMKENMLLINTTVTEWAGWLFLPDAPQIRNFSGTFSIQ